MQKKKALKIATISFIGSQLMSLLLIISNK